MAVPVTNTPAPAPASASASGPQPTRESSSKRANNELPPWKRGKAKEQVATPDVLVAAPKAKSATLPEEEVDSEPTLPLPPEAVLGGGGNFKQESTFSGERGGSAEDAELLALLRGVSAKSGSADRFAEGEGENAKSQDTKLSRNNNVDTIAKIPEGTGPVKSHFSPQVEQESEIVVTRESLADHIVDRSWKVRKSAFALMKQIIVEESKGQEAYGQILGDSVFSGLDERVADFLLEKNASVLEEVIQFAVLYVDFCKGGASSEFAESCTKNLIAGNAFTLAKPKVIAGSQDLVLKLMEVGNESSSIHAIVKVLLDEGVGSKKPKVVLMATTLLLESTVSFGAANMPLASIKKFLPKMLGQPNKKVRDLALQLIAELCRALGGKSTMGDVVDELKKPQLREVDAMLEKQPGPTPIKIGLRALRNNDRPKYSTEDAIAVLQAGAAELEAERYARRPAINLPEEVGKSEYAQHIKLPKWSAKVEGLKIVLGCGGERPFKFAPPTSSINYAPLIAEMKGLMQHTHFAVVTKAMEVLAMLSEGAGEKLFPHLRPLLPKLLSLSKDKKLTKASLTTMDAFFGNVLSFEHILASEGAIPDATSEQKEKNALARTTALDFLARCISRQGRAGPRGELTVKAATQIAELASIKLGDSQATVRQAAIAVLKELQRNDELDIKHAVQQVVDKIEVAHPRIFKQLKKESVPPVTVGIPQSTGRAVERKLVSTKHSTHLPQNAALGRESNPPSHISPTKIAQRTSVPIAPPSGIISIDDATEYIEALCIPSWDASDEDGGVLAGILSSKWLFRQNAIRAIAAFLSKRPTQLSNENLQKDTGCVMLFVKEHTRGFQETNVQVMKSIMELSLAVCEAHEVQSCVLPLWVAKDIVEISCKKISDKKLSPMAKSLLISVCVVSQPQLVLKHSYTVLSNIKSPIAHEEFLRFMKVFADDFGVLLLGDGINDAILYLLQHCESKTLKVKKGAYEVLGSLHIQLGSRFESLTLSNIKDTTLQDNIRKIFVAHPYDPEALTCDRPKRSIECNANGSGQIQNVSEAAMNIDIPVFDLGAALSSDCLVRMGSKEGKTSWKSRKAALEEVGEAMKRCTGLLDTQRLRPLVDILRALRERLSDSQSNLKPVAAKLIGIILSATDGVSQAKLGKIVFASVINSAMNDSRKVMHDACMETLQMSVSLSGIDGGEPNKVALEPFLFGLVGELDDSDFKSIGIADVLDLTRRFASSFPDMDEVASQGGATLGQRFAKVLVNGLISSKVEIRTASEALMKESVINGALAVSTIKKVVGRQKPAVQRTISPIIQKLSENESTPSDSTVKVLSDKSIAPQKDMVRTKIHTATPQKISEPSKTTSSRKVTETMNAKQFSPRRKPVVSNPLVTDSGKAGMNKSKAALRSMTWPEYPEEPSGNLLLGALKKAWAPLIPIESVKELFPPGGIKKQDDAMSGFELLSRAIVMERAGEGYAFQEQFSLIWKWITFVLCCKESTVGTQGLLQLLFNVIEHLRSIQLEISDGESMVLVPHLFEKTSIAKGRFKDAYVNLLREIKTQDLLPLKRLGPLVCVAIIEGSSHAKARLLACHECFQCVEIIGLSGVGKRGVLVIAKSLSDEKLQENRVALLDLMVLLLSRMNGDMQRLTRICGVSLNGKARSLLEDHWKKTGGQIGARSGLMKTPPRKIAQSTQISMEQRDSPTKLPSLRSQSSFTSSSNRKLEYNMEEEIKDELPALDFRTANSESTATIVNPSQYSNPLQNEKKADLSRDFQETIQDLPLEEKHDNNSHNSSLDVCEDGNDAQHTLSTHPNPESESSFGAAASLRARLLKIRARNKTTQSSHPVLASQPVLSASVSEKHDDSVTLASQNLKIHTTDISTDTCEDTSLSCLTSFVGIIRKLLSKEIPCAEDDPEILQCTDVLKSIHASVSQQPSLAITLDPAGVQALRDEIKLNSNEVVEVLTRLIPFGFQCHRDESNGGMSIPLLSVNLASLMAIFRSDDISKSIRVEDLTLLIKEAGQALLDPRLAAASSPSNSLDEATSTQMVRAINKLAVQAATGAVRHYSFQALVTLQHQLCLSLDSSEDNVFNSRLSRVVTKLFARVIKAEQSLAEPFAPSNIDQQAIICFLEDSLVSCNEAEKNGIRREAVNSVRNLAHLLISAILSSREEITSFRSAMEELDISYEHSALGQLTAKCASDLQLSTHAQLSRQRSLVEVASFVSAVGEAPIGPQRDAAVIALKKYRAEHGDEDLNNHLENVSMAFRAFILDQLSLDKEVTPPSSTMSARIKSLRSKLSATEAIVQATSEEEPSSPGLNSQIDATTTTQSSTKINAFRERLAAARISSNTMDSTEIPKSTASAGSRAAALRARLQAVKRQAEQNEY